MLPASNHFYVVQKGKVLSTAILALAGSGWLTYLEPFTSKPKDGNFRRLMGAN